MSRRIEIELTSDRADGSWTWRAAGAREPKGTVTASLLPAGAQVGDVYRAEVEQEIEPFTVLAFLPVKPSSAQPATPSSLKGTQAADGGLAF